MTKVNKTKQQNKKSTKTPSGAGAYYRTHGGAMAYLWRPATMAERNGEPRNVRIAQLMNQNAIGVQMTHDHLLVVIATRQNNRGERLLGPRPNDRFTYPTNIENRSFVRRYFFFN